MPYLYLVLSVFMVASTSVFGKIFNRQNDGRRDTSTFYNFLLMISVFLGWGMLYVADFSFDAGVLLYSAMFAICYLTCNVGIINALKYGPTAITSLLINLSLIVTTVWGFLFWDAEISLTVIAGLVLVVASIILCLYSKEQDEKGFSLKWLVYVTLAFFGNAGCSIVQRTQQVEYSGQHGNMLMLFATGACAIAYVILYLRSDKRDARIMLKASWWGPVCAGVCNVVLNMLVMLMAVTELSPSVIYPVIGVGGLAVVTVFSLLVFKEKMRWWQWIGVAVGAVAVMLLSGAG